ncbi:GATA zinc finger domain-containing protein 10 [Uranotaenia lowii]|uniref:GATA zinc finger domain-containing protein 10 n=1 Tax=Uranotaenia lowii TaxID=190385 RepID=UPI0024793BCB|nr:GATA zinc finger domain-containing protein 10 [Uranotaenia lowii]
MRNKIAALVLLASVLCPGSAIGGLLRNPKVYNAVITTDENLTPSRAYPVVQPVVHEAGLSYPFGAFGPFGLYNAFNAYPGLYQPTSSSGTSAQHQQAPAVTNSRLIAASPQLQDRQQFQQQFHQQQHLQHHAQQQHQQHQQHLQQAEFIQGRNSFYPLRTAEPEPQLQETPIETIPVPKPVPETHQPLREAAGQEIIPEPNNSIAPKAPEGPRPNYEAGHPVDSKSPLQLNEFGLPPSLIPLNNYHGQQPQQFQLQGYPYNFPALYDGFSNYNPSQYQSVLPPFGYYPQFAQPNPYFAAGVPSHPGNSVDPQLSQRAGREQDLDDAEKDRPQEDGAPEAGPSTEDAAEAAKAEADDSKSGEPEGAASPVPSPAESTNISESIKNNANKNKAIPDVAPPPIPSGAKATQ